MNLPAPPQPRPPPPLLLCSAPSRAPPCQGEAAACLACYRESGEDALRCADAVDAYSRCAREAWAEALQR